MLLNIQSSKMGTFATFAKILLVNVLDIALIHMMESFL